MSETTHNGDDTIRPGDTGQQEAQQPAEQLQDQPQPGAAAVIDPATFQFDALLALTELPDQGGMNVRVVVKDKEPDPMNNPAHFMANWISRNFQWMAGLAMDQWQAEKAVAEFTERNKIRLVAADGSRLTP